MHDKYMNYKWLLEQSIPFYPIPELWGSPAEVSTLPGPTFRLCEAQPHPDVFVALGRSGQGAIDFLPSVAEIRSSMLKLELVGLL